MFLSVVALEDFVPELGNMLFNIKGFDTCFPESKELAQKQKSPKMVHSRRDEDAAGLRQQMEKILRTIHPYLQNQWKCALMILKMMFLK